MASPLKVLVVDDSAFARKVLRDCLTSAGLDVVGVAFDGLQALEMIDDLCPDVITLDLVMPNLDGLGVLKALAAKPPVPGRPAPRVVVVSISDSDTMLGLAALEAGAFEVVHKPTALATTALYELGDELVAVVKAAAAATPRTPGAPMSSPRPPRAAQSGFRLVVIGASTGGPQALTLLMSALPADFPLPIALVLHMPPGYTAALAQRLNEGCKLEVLEAADGMKAQGGRVIVARAGQHLRLVREGGLMECALSLLPLASLHRPAVDVLFQSAAELTSGGTLGVVLTGMGEDGLVGARAICAAGGSMITESEPSCVVYGMPRVVVEAGLSAAQVPIERMAEEILRFV